MILLVSRMDRRAASKRAAATTSLSVRTGGILDETSNLCSEIGEPFLRHSIADVAPAVGDLLARVEHLPLTGLRQHLALEQLVRHCLRLRSNVRGIPARARAIDAVLLRLSALPAHRTIGRVRRNVELPQVACELRAPMPQSPLLNVETYALLAHGFQHEMNVGMVLVRVQDERVTVLAPELLGHCDRRRLYRATVCPPEP